MHVISSGRTSGKLHISDVGKNPSKIPGYLLLHLLLSGKGIAL
jgi:hypothetical protein